MTDRNQLVWFRNDFRLRDNRAWAAACDQREPVAAVYIFCQEQLSHAHDVGAARLDFNARNLESLHEVLREAQVPLYFLDVGTFEHVPDQLAQLCEALEIASVHWNEEYARNEQARDQAVRVRLGDMGIAVHAHTDQLLIAPDRIRNGSGEPYKVFTPFRRAWYQALRPADYAESTHCAPRPAANRRPASALQAAQWRKLLSEHRDAGQPAGFPAGEAEAAARLESFVGDRLAEYRQQRDYPAADATSALSPYLSAGVISVRACLRAALAANDGELETGQAGAVTWISELIWREFYRHVLVAFPWVNWHLPFKRETAAVPWRQDEEDFARWCEGRTGYPIVDAAQRQLNETGWMHNRLRMISAMFLSKHLLIDWRWGERYFMQKLVDGDFASNNGGWQWSASTGTDAQPYFRIFNPVTQSEKFDPEGAFIRRYVPELRDRKGRDIHQPQESGDLLEGSYPPAIVEHKFARERALNAFKAD